MAKADAAESAVFHYMKQQNRPYSAADVFLNLHKVHGKTAVIKAMEALAASGKLVEKIYGKSKIYVINQNEFPVASGDEIGAMDKNIEEITKKSAIIQSELKSLKAELKLYLNTFTTEEANSEVEKLKSEIMSLKARLDMARNAMHDISEQDRKDIKRNHTTFTTLWRKRKRMTTDLMNAVLEGYPKSKKTFIEEVGIETDEEYKVTMPQT